MDLDDLRGIRVNPPSEWLVPSNAENGVIIESVCCYTHPAVLGFGCSFGVAVAFEVFDATTRAITAPHPRGWVRWHQNIRGNIPSRIHISVPFSATSLTDLNRMDIACPDALFVLRLGSRFSTSFSPFISSSLSLSAGFSSCSLLRTDLARPHLARQNDRHIAHEVLEEALHRHRPHLTWGERWPSTDLGALGGAGRYSMKPATEKMTKRREVAAGNETENLLRPLKDRGKVGHL